MCVVGVVVVWRRWNAERWNCNTAATEPPGYVRPVRTTRNVRQLVCCKYNNRQVGVASGGRTSGKGAGGSGGVVLGTKAVGGKEGGTNAR